MSKTEDFLTKKQEQHIIDAIVVAEQNTSGEIRVHIEEKSEKPPMERAQEVFNLLKMDETELKNGVLFYVCVHTKKFAIIGDKGINEKVAADFWENTKELVISHFKEGKHKKGLIEGILLAGENLKKHFPKQANDSNELTNEISRG
jgi:uncharacterized membrane protein